MHYGSRVYYTHTTTHTRVINNYRYPLLLITCCIFFETSFDFSKGLNIYRASKRKVKVLSNRSCSSSQTQKRNFNCFRRLIIIKESLIVVRPRGLIFDVKQIQMPFHQFNEDNKLSVFLFTEWFCWTLFVFLTTVDFIKSHPRRPFTIKIRIYFILFIFIFLSL